MKAQAQTSVFLPCLVSSHFLALNQFGTDPNVKKEERKHYTYSVCGLEENEYFFLFRK